MSSSAKRHVGQPDQRARAVRATIETSTGLLNGLDASRFTELDVFAEDDTIPLFFGDKIVADDRRSGRFESIPGLQAAEPAGIDSATYRIGRRYRHTRCYSRLSARQARATSDIPLTYYGLNRVGPVVHLCQCWRLINLLDDPTSATTSSPGTPRPELD
jgi:hypothetical protein